MNERDGRIEPVQMDDALPDTLTPQDWGFPVNPTTPQVRSWTRQQLWLEAFAESGSIGAACQATTAQRAAR